MLAPSVKAEGAMLKYGIKSLKLNHGAYYLLNKGRPHLQGVPLPKTIHWIVFGIHPCGAPVGYGALPRAPQGLSALDLTKGL